MPVNYISAKCRGYIPALYVVPIYRHFASVNQVDYLCRSSLSALYADTEETPIHMYIFLKYAGTICRYYMPVLYIDTLSQPVEYGPVT
ncbi:MAG: hypothetical protein WCQ70_03550 [Lentimicrobiaceae bacterium]